MIRRLERDLQAARDDSHNAMMQKDEEIWLMGDQLKQKDRLLKTRDEELEKVNAELQEAKDCLQKKTDQLQQFEEASKALRVLMGNQAAQQ